MMLTHAEATELAHDTWQDVCWVQADVNGWWAVQTVDGPVKWITAEGEAIGGVVTY